MDLWTFVTDEKNQRTLGWLGGGAAVAAAGIWAVVTFVWPHHDTPAAQAGNCGIASTGTANGNSITCGAVTSAPSAKP